MYLQSHSIMPSSTLLRTRFGTSSSHILWWHECSSVNIIFQIIPWSIIKDVKAGKWGGQETGPNCTKQCLGNLYQGLIEIHMNNGLHIPHANSKLCGQYQAELLLTKWLMCLSRKSHTSVQLADCCGSLPQWNERYPIGAHHLGEMYLST